MANIVKNIFTIPELRKRILFTIGMLFIFRLGAHIPVPGIDAGALAEATAGSAGRSGLLGLVNLFSGGALMRFSLFGLGIMPYITASIIIQLLTVVVPALERLSKEGEQGRKKIQQYTRYGTVLISMVQAYGYIFILKGMASSSSGAYPAGEMALFTIGFVASITVGTVFLMWIGEQITERGIGNGISLLIFAGIVARLPQALYQTYTQVVNDTVNPVALLLLVGILMLVVGFVVIEQTGTRKIPVQYAKRVVGRKVYSSQATHIPFKINPSGVIPIIFASSVILFPAQIASFFKDSAFLQSVANMLDPKQHWFYYVFYTLLVMFFAYFYTAIQFNPKEIAENLKKHGGFIPGIRPGPQTATFLSNVLNRITAPGSMFLAALALFPSVILLFSLFQNVPESLVYLMGGTSLLIIVAVDLDLMKQIESHLLMRHYDGFFKKGRLRSGRSR